VKLFRRSAPDSGKPVRVHIGAGQRHLDGWINVDNQALPGVDRVLDVREGLPFSNVSAIFAEHFLEHLALDDGLAFLRTCRNVLRPDGILRLSTPNLAWVIASHYRLDESLPLDQGLFDCLRTNKAFHAWGHQFLYNRATLELALRAAGFTDFSAHEYGQSPHPELCGLEGHDRSDDFPGLPHVLIAEASGISDRPVPLPAEWLAEFRRDLRSR